MSLVGRSCRPIAARSQRELRDEDLQERSHDLAAVRLDDALQRRHGAGDLGRGDEAHDAKHSQAAVVDLSHQPLGLSLGRAVLGEAKRVVQVERHGVRDAPAERRAKALPRLAEIEARVVARLATRHVVLLTVALEHELRLGPDLQEANDTNDLQL